MKILVAIHNQNKLEEYKSFLSTYKIDVVSLRKEKISVHAPEVGNTYLEMAQNKALFYSRLTKLPLVTEASGLEIHALGAFPGIRSDTWLHATDKERNLELIKKMQGVKDRKSFYKLVMVYLHRKRLVPFSGEISGQIAQKPEGIIGADYDPIFYIPSKKRTLGQILLFEKREFSPRAQALQKLVSYLKKYEPQ